MFYCHWHLLWWYRCCQCWLSYDHWVFWTTTCKRCSNTSWYGAFFTGSTWDCGTTSGRRSHTWADYTWRHNSMWVTSFDWLLFYYCYFITLLNLVIILFHMTGTGAVRYNKLTLKIKSRSKIFPFRDDMTIESFLLLIGKECGPGVTCLVLNDGKVLLNLDIHVFNYLIYYAIHHMLLYYTSSLSQL